MFGIMLNLVGANSLTFKMEHLSSNYPTVMYITSAISPPEMCKTDYECEANLCWRTCNETPSVVYDESNDVDERSIIKWCFTSPEANRSTYQHMQINVHLAGIAWHRAKHDVRVNIFFILFTETLYSCKLYAIWVFIFTFTLTIFVHASF